MNLHLPRSRTLRYGGITAALLVMNLLPTSFSGPIGSLVVGVAALAFAGYLLWRVPFIGAGLLLLQASQKGGLLILIAAPAVIVFGARQLHSDFGLTRSWSGIARTVGLALLAALVTLPFATVTVSSRSAPNPGGAKPPPGLDQLLSVLAWLARHLPTWSGDDGQPRPLEDQGAPPDLSWLKVVGALTITAIAVALIARWWWRRRHNPVAPAPVAAPLARLEAVGAGIGRQREPHEGALAYASALSEYTGDKRLIEAGPLISGVVYESRTADTTSTEQRLTGVELDPPPRPPRLSLRQRLARLTDRLRQIRFTRRRLAIIAAVIISVGLGGPTLISRLDTLSDDPVTPEVDTDSWGP